MKKTEQNYNQILDLARLSDAVSHARRPEDIYELALDALQKIIHADKASVLLFDENDVMQFVASRNLSAEYKKAASGHSPWQPNATNPEPIVVANAIDESSLAELLPVIQKEGIAALGFIPLICQDKLLGKFMIYFNTPHNFTDSEIGLAQTIAKDVAFAIWEKKSETTLKKTLQELKEIVENSIDTIFKMDMNGNFLFMSPEFFRMYNYTKQEIIGKHFSSFVHPDDLRTCRDAFAVLLTTKMPQRGIVYRTIAKNGHIVWANTSASVVCNENGEPQYVLGISKDITKINEANALQKASEERYKAFIQQSSEAIWRGELTEPVNCNDSIHVQLKNFYCHGYLAECNDQMARLYGFKEANDILGAKLEDFIKINNELTKALSNEFIQNGYRLYRRPSIQITAQGVKKYFLNNLVGIIENGFVVRVWGMQTDITEQRLAEKALIASEQFHKSLFAGSVDGTVVLNIDGYIMYAAPSVTNVLGYATDEMIGRRADEFIYSEDIPYGHQIFYDVINNRNQSNYHEVRYVAKDGRVMWVMMRAHNMFMNPSVAGMAIYFTDITKRKITELALQQSEEKYRTLVEQASDGIFITGEDGKFLVVNSAGCKMSGYSNEELLAMNIYKLVNVDGLVVNPLQFEQMMQPQGARSERKMVCKDGTIIDVEISAKFLSDKRLIAFVRDITERKKAEQELRLKENALNTSISGMGMADLNGIIFYANDTLAKIWGYEKKEELMGKHIVEMLDDIRTEDTLNSLTANGYEWGDTVGKKKDGTLFDVTFSANIVYDNNGQPFCMFGSFIDVTENKKAEKELENSYEAVRKLTNHLQNIREEERAHIAREIHDELGQQLTGLKMDLVWLGKQVSSASDEVYEKINDSLSLINKSINTVRRIATELRPSILDDLGLVAALEWQTEEFSRRFGIEAEFENTLEDVKLVSPEATALFRIYQELLTNAARHAECKKVHAVFSTLNNQLLLTVSDNGVGFDTAIAGNKKTLGLLGIKERASLIGGSCTINSKPGIGTVVVIAIPYAVNESLQTNKTEAV